MLVTKINNGYKCSYRNLDCELINHVIAPFNMEVVYNENTIRENFLQNLEKIEKIVEWRRNGVNYQLTDGWFADLLK